jgi:hypothetical protein
MLKEERVEYSYPQLIEREAYCKRNAADAFFLHKEIPLDWVLRLCALNSTAVKVGLALAYRSILTKKNPLQFSGYHRRQFQISPDQWHRSLSALKDARLVDYEMVLGKSPLVKLLFQVESL